MSALGLLTRFGLTKPPGGPPPDWAEDWETHTVAAGVPAGWTAENFGNNTAAWSITNTSPIAGTKSLQVSAANGEGRIATNTSFPEDFRLTLLFRVDNTGSIQNLAIKLRGDAVEVRLQAGTNQLYVAGANGACTIAGNTVYELTIDLSGSNCSATVRNFSIGTIIATVSSSSVSSGSPGGSIGIQYQAVNRTALLDNLRAYYL